MGLRQRFGNGQSQTKSAKTPLKRAVALLEWIKNSFHDFGFDADASIAHSDQQHLGRRLVDEW